MKNSDAEFPMLRGFQTVSDEVFDGMKQESQDPIIDRCPLSEHFTSDRA